MADIPIFPRGDAEYDQYFRDYHSRKETRMNCVNCKMPFQRLQVVVIEKVNDLYIPPAHKDCYEPAELRNALHSPGTVLAIYLATPEQDAALRKIFLDDETPTPNPTEGN